MHTLMRVILFITPMALSNLAVAESPYVGAYVAYATDRCSSDCDNPSDVKKSSVGVMAGGYAGMRYIAGGDFYITDGDTGADLYIGMKPTDHVKAVLGAGMTLLDMPTDEPRVTVRSQIVSKDTPATSATFIFADVAWHNLFARYSIYNITNKYSYMDQIGTDINGEPVYGPIISYSSQVDRDVVSIGYRYVF